MTPILAVVWLAVGAVVAPPSEPPLAPPVPPASEARTLLAGCLVPPTPESVTKLAAAVGAIPYSDARATQELARQDTTIVPDPTRPGQAARTVTTLSAFHGWDLPGPDAGTLEYFEDFARHDRIDQTSGQSISAAHVLRGQTCHLEAPVASGRAMFELFETLDDRPYGILVTPDRRTIIAFIFDETQAEVDLAMTFDAPLAGLPVAGPADGDARLVMDDGGPRFLNGVIPGVPVVKLSRAALLAAIDQPAKLTLSNSRFQPLVQRLGAAFGRAAYPLAFTGAAPST